MVCHVENHFPKFTFVHELAAFWALKEVFFFFRRQLFVFGKCHFLALNSEKVVRFRGCFDAKTSICSTEQSCAPAAFKVR